MGAGICQLDNTMRPTAITPVRMKNKIAIYDLTLDKRIQKIGHGKKLVNYPLEKLPKFLRDNLNIYQKWMD